MELVQAFNAELSSLYEVKPPISKAKMGTITKTAIKGIKMYKHIVQSVERFIAKCRPEYKVPGLYVVDSIVRQSRHQFGPDKDVFGPRFTRNFQQTFQNLFLTCPIDDKPKIVRVLNLWQRNGVFTSEVIQPLLDMANPNSQLPPIKNSPKNQSGQEQTTDSNNDANFVMQLRHLTNSLAMSKSNNGTTFNMSNNSETSQIKFNKKLLDFDYGDDDDDEKGETPNEPEPSTSGMLNKSSNNEDIAANPLALNMAQNLLLNPKLLQKLQASIQATNNNSNSVSMELDFSSSSMFDHNMKDNLKSNSDYNNSSLQNYDGNKNDRNFGRSGSRSRSRSPASNSARKARFRDRNSYKDRDERTAYRYERERERERDRSRSDRRYRSRSKSPRNGCDRHGNELAQINSYELAKEKEREKERERKKKGLPPVRKGYVTICSTTLWLGHLPKTTSEINISDALGEFGTINTIDYISARGCAYVCMNRRQDAVRAINNLKNLKINNANIKMAWAPGKGMKDKEFKDYWNVETGVSYIPEEKLNKDVDLELLEDGGCIDEDTVPDFLKKLQQERKEKEAAKNAEAAASSKNNVITSIAQPVPPMIPPPVQTIPTIGPVPVAIPPFALGLPPPPPPHGLNPLGAPSRLLPPNGPPMLPPRLNQLMVPPPPPPPVEDDNDDDITIIDQKTNDKSDKDSNSNKSSDSPLKGNTMNGSAINAVGEFPPLMPGHHASHLGLGPNLIQPPPRAPLPWLPGSGPHSQMLGPPPPPNMPMLAGQPLRLSFNPDKRNGMFRHDKSMRPPLFDMPPLDPSLMHRPPRSISNLAPPLPGGPPFGPMGGPSKYFK